MTKFVEVAKNVADEIAKDTALKIAHEVNGRAEFEAKKASDNEKIQNTLKQIYSATATASFARFCVAANVPVNYINKSERAGARFNVYAAQKLANIGQVLMLDNPWNAINNAILRSIFKCEKAGVEFAHKLAVAACSKNITIDAGLSKHLVRHTVSPTTASTQASSTMNALQVAGVVSAYKNDAGVDCYKLTSNPIVDALREKLGL